MVMKIASFDIFDTCLHLQCGSEEQMFFILAYTILGDNAINDDVYEFVRIRKNAEKEVRKKTTDEEITTSEIYSYCDFSSLTSLSNEQIKQTEFLIVKKLLLPITLSIKKIEYYRSQGWNILYISDMHLPQWVLRDVLLQNGLFVERSDRIFVSSEYCKTKNTGSLYEYIKKSLPDKIDKWIHFGDNRRSDYVNAKKYGIHACLLTKCNSLKYSGKAMEDELDYIQRPLFTVASLSKSIYNSLITTDTYSAMYLDLIAPFFTSSVYRILNDAHEKGIKHLLFFARDSYVLFHIAKKLNYLFPDVNIHYVYVSRRVMYLPSVKEISHKGFTSLKSIKGLSLYDYLDQFSLSMDELIIDNKGDTELQLDSIFVNPQNIELISKRKKELEICLLSYIRQQVPSMQAMAMVDMTGSRSSQQALNDFLLVNGFQLLHAYYLLVSEDRKSVSDAGRFTASLYSDFLKHGNYRFIGDLTLLFEDVFSVTDQNRTIGYKEVNKKIEPLYDDEHNQWKTDYMKKNLSLLDKYVKGYLSTKLYLCNNDISRLSIRNLGVFARNPYYKYVKSLEDFRISENNTNSKKLLSKPWLHDYLWYRGSIVSLGPYMNMLIDLIYKFKHTNK